MGRVSNVGKSRFELLRRDYFVSVGKLNNNEIDFVVIKNNITEYYQVCYEMPKFSDRKESNLLGIKDNYKKTIITANRMDVGNISGIDIVHITDFLLND
jgi:predicted AAA+ superfamily ATPase